MTGLGCRFIKLDGRLRTLFDAVSAVMDNARQAELGIEIAELGRLAIPLRRLQHVLSLAFSALLIGARNGKLRFIIAGLGKLFLLVEAQCI